MTLTQSTQWNTFNQLNGKAHSRRILLINISVSCNLCLPFQLYAISLQYLAAQIPSHGGHSQRQTPLAVAKRESCFPSNLTVSIYSAWQPYCHTIAACKIIHTILGCRDIQVSTVSYIFLSNRWRHLMMVLNSNLFKCGTKAIPE
jgi:hypothetical protein